MFNDGVVWNRFLKGDKIAVDFLPMMSGWLLDDSFLVEIFNVLRGIRKMNFGRRNED